MKEDKLGDLSTKLAVDVLALVKELEAKREKIISNQIGRSATSVCANIAESKYAHGRADYITEERYKQLNKTCSTIRILLIASLKTAKANR